MIRLTHERARQVFDYDQESGHIIWRITCSSRGAAGTKAGQVTNHGYRLIRIDGEGVLAHRLAWFWMTGSWPAGDVDHINMQRDDNRWVNLREATRSQNKANTKAPGTNTSGWKGVSWHKLRGRWRATIKSEGRSVHLGLFDTPEEAHAAYQAAAERLFGSFSRPA